MQWKISVFLLVAMLCLAFTGSAAAEDDVKCCWEKPCGTEVEQCDQETVFTLNDVDPETEVVKVTGDYYYVSMRNVTNDEGDRIITSGDIRLSGWHDKYDPNTKIAPGDWDASNPNNIVTEVIDEPFKYMDINENEQYDLYDPVYVDVNEDDEISEGDIRLTAVPPVDVYSLVKVENQYGELLEKAGSWGFEAWSIVKTADEDRTMALSLIDSGEAADLLGWVDADDSGDWTCEDKLYIRAINNHDWFEDVVTINDVRLYIPPGDACVPECGTKVVQGDHDATYALTLNDDAKLVQLESEPTAIYISMDGSDEVTIGDVRLTGMSTQYDPNTKVTFSNKYDLGWNYVEMDQDAIKYANIDGLPGYSLGDPLYIDIDGDEVVSNDDYRLTASPVFDQQDMVAGEAGDAWSLVTAGPTVNDDADAGWELATVGSIPGVLGYIDSDATGDWTCPDKLYLQQIVKDIAPRSADNCDGAQHDYFVTVGDHRIYEPFSDEMSPFYELEDWPVCGTKVTMCDIDATFALMDHTDNIEDLLKYTDRNENGYFDAVDNAYVDMDNNSEVSVGDVRLTDVQVDGHYFYYNNTKVVQHDKDIEEKLKYGGLSTFAGDGANENRDLLSMISTGMDIKIFDTDCSGDWTCVDALYIQTIHDTDRYNDANLDFVTHGDGRLYIPPDMICDEPVPGTCGDVTGDEMVNLGDVILLFNHVTDGTPIDDESVADVTGDGNINLGDVILLFNHVTDGTPLNCS